MERFNFAAPEYKNAFKKDVESRAVSASSAMIVVWGAILAVTILTAIQFLHIQNTSLERSIEVARTEEEVLVLEEFEKQAKELNTTLNKIKASIAQAEGPEPAFLLQQIAALVPSGAYLNEFNYSRTAGRVIIRGHAPLRAQVIVLRDRLRESELFEEVDSPATNVLQGSNINFVFTLTLSDE